MRVCVESTVRIPHLPVGVDGHCARMLSASSDLGVWPARGTRANEAFPKVNRGVPDEGSKSHTGCERAQPGIISGRLS